MGLIDRSDRIFVAGHRGMAGSAICRALVGRGYTNLLTAGRDVLDLLDPVAVAGWFATNRPDVVVLAAAKVGGILANASYPADFLLENLKIQNHVIENAWRQGARRLLFLGSSCIYPKFAPQPIREESLLTGTLERSNEWYAIAKISGIQLCRALRQQHGFDAISLMPTNLYGPGDNYHPTNSHVLPALIRRFHEAREAGAVSVSCWGSGSPLREFLHADDLADAAVFCLESWQPAITPEHPDPLQFLNVGTGVDLPIRELAALVADAVGYRGEILWDTSKPDGTPKKQLDVSRLAALGWTARIPLSEGLQRTAATYGQDRQAAGLQRQ
ncbi:MULTISPECIES: GDP-L-fucose synthase [unclassified Synechococcus]|uniref:GDP-L-fucose synthase family protein n=1 Tax=unclassified Synechococcus TaxID=2626047 RepID=UPI0021A8851B|nr:MULTISPECIES: GDP-L-fucose synthase [unclassified Synechococcus]MCT0214357.1 GDP-L-fucose synthase [Synechococcus sp. CS-1326]MCT0234521.1 GDP-L-fucose synthase [Synechococcus sp. CS-1327]